MSKANARRAELVKAPSAELLSYVEQTCHGPDDQLLAELQPVTFRLFSVGRGLGKRVDTSFTADYGLYYDSDDDRLISLLQYAVPEVNWFHNKVYHRWLDKSRIQVLNGNTGGLVAQIETRRYMGKAVKPDAVERGEYGPGVLTLSQLRAAREAEAAARAENDNLIALEDEDAGG